MSTTTPAAGIFPEKFAMYFATMNSLSGKIYSDVQAAEETIAASAGLSYSEKCAVLDKYLIHDVLQKPRVKPKQQLKQNQCNGNGIAANANGINKKDILSPLSLREDPNFAQADQLRSLLAAVYPKNPEKYVFEENGVWVDEHSAPFSFCKQSQVKSCPLGELVKNLPKSGSAEILDAKTNNYHPIETDSDHDLGQGQGQPKPKPVSIKKDKPKTKAKAKAKPSFFGVNVMGFMGGESEEGQQSQKIEISAGNSEDKQEQEEEEQRDPEEESNLPKQKQNLELIAELQAKLKKSNSGGKAGIGHVQPSKVSKPKAPPPPPPAAIPVKTENSEKKKPKEKLKKTEKKATEVKAKEKEPETKQPLKSPLLKQASASKEQEFCVDVSSPCRIATPKTGLDFLDNW